MTMKMNQNTATFLSTYYFIKPWIPRSVQIWFRREVIRRRMNHVADRWPVLPAAGVPEKSWSGWPEKKQFAVVTTHDVESEKGLKRCKMLASAERQLGFRSSFNFVPGKYQVPDSLRYDLEKDGFEVGIHGLYHDGKLYESWQVFEKRAKLINQYLKAWKVCGFRSPAMHHNLNWLQNLNIAYDASTFDTDPFEPQSDGVETIFPFWVAGENNGKGFVELPYTLPQDFTVYILLQEKTSDIWKRKIDWIARKGGMALVNTHPDYMCFNGKKPTMEEYDVDLYLDFLQYIKDRFKESFWHALPRDVAHFFKNTYCL